MARTGNGSTSNYFSRGNSVSEPFTVCCWIYLTSIAANNGIWQQCNNGANFNYYSLQTDTSGNILAVSRNSTPAFSTTGTISTNTWHHVAGIWRAANYRIVYLDGVAGTADTTSQSPSSQNEERAGSTRITGTPGNWNTLTGRIAELGVWDVELTASEIKALAGGCSPLRVRTASLTGYFPPVSVV